MKKIVSILLLLALSILAFAACGEASATEYTLSVATDVSVSGTKASTVVVALVTDAEGKIVAARFDALDANFALNSENQLSIPDVMTTKVELGDLYTGMASGSWADQAAAYESYIIGKTKAEIASLDDTLVTGCTMSNSKTTFKALLAKAFDSTYAVKFESSTVPTLGVAINGKMSGSIDDASGKFSADYAGVAMVDGKVVAAKLDSAEVTLALAIGDDGLECTSSSFNGTKNELGENYVMPAGAWYKQAQAFADSAVGKTASELTSLEVVSDALAEAGCTMKNTTGGYKATIIKAASAAR